VPCAEGTICLFLVKHLRRGLASLLSKAPEQAGEVSKRVMGYHLPFPGFPGIYTRSGKRVLHRSG
jgi:hypothetical protein